MSTHPITVINGRGSAKSHQAPMENFQFFGQSFRVTDSINHKSHRTSFNAITEDILQQMYAWIDIKHIPFFFCEQNIKSQSKSRLVRFGWMILMILATPQKWITKLNKLLKHFEDLGNLLKASEYFHSKIWKLWNCFVFLDFLIGLVSMNKWSCE